MFLKKFLFAISFISIATAIGIAGYSHFSKPKPALAQTVPAPVLHFSDLTSGPKTGLGDGLGSGAIVTIWGVNLGSTQGTSKVYVGNVEASYVYEWTNATQHAGHPADLYTYHKMQTIAFSVPATAIDGSNTIKVIVNGVTSNTLPFTVRTGKIYFVKTTGVDASGMGSWSSPFKTMNYVNKSTSNGGPNPGPVAGDTIYIADNITDTDPYVYYNNGTAEAPISLIAYPGAHVTILSPRTGWGPYNHGSVYWNISKISVKSGGAGILTFRGMRAIGVEITNYPGGCATGQSGAIANDDLGNNIADTIGGGIKVYGAYIHDFGCNTSSKLHHVFYISNRGGVIQQSYELGWNYLTDNKVNGALHVYDENVCGDFSGVMKIHDNVVVNQSSAGFDVGSGGSSSVCFSMELQVYNNLFVNVGLINPGGDIVHANAIGINGWNNHANVKIYNNTFYGFGDPAGTEPSFFSDMVAGSGGIFPGTWQFINNIIINTRDIPYVGPAVAFTPPNIHSNNLWYNPNGIVAAPSWDTMPLISDPQFTNPSTGDFHLQPSSPAIDAGINLISTVVNDLEGIIRPQGLAFDIGAYEYITSTPPPLPPIKGDFNSDSKVNNLDFTSFKNAFKSIFNSIFDLNSDTVIDVKDLGVLMSGWLP